MTTNRLPADPAPGPAHQAPRGRLRRAAWPIAALIVGLGLGAIGAGGGSGSTAGSPAPTVTVTAEVAQPAITVTETATPQPPPPAAGTVMDQDGVYVVGADIKRGTWHTRGAVDVGGGLSNCYYALLSSTNTDDIIDNNNVNGPATITVGPGVKAVDVSGCKPWHRISG
jgi:hypothetical protein